MTAETILLMVHFCATVALQTAQQVVRLLTQWRRTCKGKLTELARQAGCNSGSNSHACQWSYLRPAGKGVQ